MPRERGTALSRVPNSGLAGWRAGGLAGWRAGGLAGWRAGGLAGWRAGGLAGWRAGGLARRQSAYARDGLPGSAPYSKPTDPDSRREPPAALCYHPAVIPFFLWRWWQLLRGNKLTVQYAELWAEWDEEEDSVWDVTLSDGLEDEDWSEFYEVSER